MSTKADDVQEAWGAFFIAHSLAIRSIESYMGNEAPLSLDEYDVLLTVNRSPAGQIRFSDLAIATVFTRSGISRITRRLIDRGFLLRDGCKEDKRGAYAKLTTDGREAMKNTWKLYSEAISALLDPCFNHDEVKDLKRYLERIIEKSKGESLVTIGRKRRASTLSIQQ